VTLGVPKKIYEETPTGKHLSPEEFHQVLETKPDNLFLIDCRNDYEWRIGRFKGAVTPPVRKFSQFAEWVDENLDNMKFLCIALVE